MGTGAIYCQLLDSLYPGRISLNKVNWKAKLEYEFIQNYKLLQSSFDKLAIHKKIDVKNVWIWIGWEIIKMQVSR